jgi:hypothetical protein
VVRCQAEEATWRRCGQQRWRWAHTHTLHAEAEAANGAAATWPGRGVGNLVLLRLSEQEVAGCLAVAPTL